MESSDSKNVSYDRSLAMYSTLVPKDSVFWEHIYWQKRRLTVLGHFFVLPPGSHTKRNCINNVLLYSEIGKRVLHGSPYATILNFFIYKQFSNIVGIFKKKKSRNNIVLYIQ